MIQLVAVALLTLGGAGCNRNEADESVLPSPTGSELPKPAIPKIEGDDVRPGSSGARNVEDGFRGTGTLVVKDEAQLGPKATGVITAITVDEGDRVEKGRLLFRLDSRQAVLAVKQGEAALTAAKVNLSSAELDEQRTKQLLDRGSVAPAVYDAAKTRLEAAQAGVEQAKAALGLARQMAAETAVFSPIDGVVTAKLKNVGETATMVPPTVVLVVENLSALELRARLPERLLAEISVGKPMRVTFPALGETRTVPISRITPTVDPRTRTVEVVADIDNRGGTLKSGMLAEISLLDGAAGAPAPSSSAPKAESSP